MLSSDRIRARLKGFPDNVVGDCLDFERTRDPEALNRFVAGVLQFYQEEEDEANANGGPAQPADFENLSLESVTVAELIFLVEDLFDLEIEDNELRGVKTLDDLTRFVVIRARSIPSG